MAKLTGFAGTVGYISSVGLPLPTIAAAAAVVVEIGASLALLAGFGTRTAALALAVFTLVGGLLAIAANGAGALSLDARCRLN